MDPYKVAIYVRRAGAMTLLYIGDAVLTDGQAALVLEWDPARPGVALQTLALEPALLVRTPPHDPAVRADWCYIVDMPRTMH